MGTKTISGVRGWQAPMVFRDTAYASQVDGWHLYRGNRGGGVVSPPTPAGASFYAPLYSDLTERVSGHAVTYTRNSDGWYRDNQGVYRVAGNNVPRFEDNYFLREPPVTNIVDVYNANPDAALINWNTTRASLTRVSDPSALAVLGLQNICSSGNVIRCTSSAGGTNFSEAYTPFASGAVSGTFTFTVYINTYGRDVVLYFNDVPLDLTNTVNTDSLQKVSLTYTTSATSSHVSMLEQNSATGSYFDFILPQVEELPVGSSPIVTQGATASRAADILTYANASTFFPDTSTALAEVKPVSNQLPAVQSAPNNWTNMVSLDITSETRPVLSYEYVSGTCNLVTRTATSSPSFVSLDAITDGTPEKIATINGIGGTTLQVFQFSKGTKRVGSSVPSGAWNRQSEDILTVVYEGGPDQGPVHIRSIIIYPEAKDEAWLDANWLCDGCFPS